ncbi:MAG TPA: hypothetical protein V6D00_08195 [Pantanalinema sp.]
MMRFLVVCAMLALGGCAHLQEKASIQDMQVARPGELTQERVKGFFLGGNAPAEGVYRNITSAPDAVSAELWSAYPPMGQRLAIVRVALGKPGDARQLGLHYEPEMSGAERHMETIRRGLEAYLAE